MGLMLGFKRITYDPEQVLKEFEARNIVTANRAIRAYANPIHD